MDSCLLPPCSQDIPCSAIQPSCSAAIQASTAGSLSTTQQENAPCNVFNHGNFQMSLLCTREMVALAGNASAAMRRLAECRAAASTLTPLPAPLVAVVGLLAAIILLLGRSFLTDSDLVSHDVSAALILIYCCCRPRQTRRSARRCLAGAEQLLEHYVRKHAVTPERRVAARESLALLERCKTEA